MTDNAARIQKLIRQQAAIAAFGTFALREDDLLKILTEAARVCAQGLDVPFSKVCRYRAAENDLHIEAGYGWAPGVVGHVVSRADKSSPQGQVFITGQPSICNDLRKDRNFELPPFYIAHGIISTVDVLIRGEERPYGVLEIDNDTQHDYDQHDIDFLTSFANVLAEAVATSARTTVLQATIRERNRLLAQTNVLAEELQHRVRNSLQLVRGMLSKQLTITADEAGQRGINAIARRVSALAQVHDHLLGHQMTRTIDFGTYLKSLCLSLVDIQPGRENSIALTCDSASVFLDLDKVTAMGIVVTELVANSYEHAFSDGHRPAAVSVRCVTSDDVATMTIRDNGRGFNANADTKRHGIGLVRRLVQQVHGTADLESERGAVWTITFPLDKAAQSARSV